LKKELIRLVNHITNEFNTEIEKLDYLPTSVRIELLLLFEQYNPYKERAFFFKTILDSLGVDKSISKMFYLGIESAFISYYCKDDLIDGTTFKPLRFSERMHIHNQKLLHSDILLEISHKFLNSFAQNFDNRVQLNFLYKALQQLSIGQLISLRNSIKNYPSSQELIKICYLKSGSLFEAGILSLSNLILNLKDYEILLDSYKLFGIGSQLRNDIEDFILVPDSTNRGILEDLSNGQANYVLSLFFESEPSEIEILEIARFYSKNSKKTNYQDDIFEILENRQCISNSILKLKEIRDQIIVNLSNYSDPVLSGKLSKYIDYFLTIHSYLKL
jgi:geranylgeranyl pyrophosphate synthase